MNFLLFDVALRNALSIRDVFNVQWERIHFQLHSVGLLCFLPLKQYLKYCL